MKPLPTDLKRRLKKLRWQGGFHFLWRAVIEEKKEIFHQHCWLDCAPVLLTQICAGPFENQSRLIQNYLKYNYSLANDIGNIITRICCAPHTPYCIYAQLIKCLMVANTWCQAKAEFAFSISAQRPFQLMPGISLVTLILENISSSQHTYICSQIIYIFASLPSIYDIKC